MTLQLSHSHGANLMNRMRMKMTVAGKRNASDCDSGSHEPSVRFHSRQTQNPMSTRTSGPQIPKLKNQKVKKGRLKSPMFCTHPGCKPIMEPALKRSVIRKTKNV